MIPAGPGVLIEQFRPGPCGRLDPWLIEVVAGIIDPGAAEEVGVARRKPAVELAPERSAPSDEPGAVETVTCSAAGSTDGVGGIHGLDEENEDIRSTAPAEALDRLRSARCQCTTVLCLQWLALNRDRLRERGLRKAPRNGVMAVTAARAPSPVPGTRGARMGSRRICGNVGNTPWSNCPRLRGNRLHHPWQGGVPEPGQFGRDRAAKFIILDAEERGGAGGTVVEGTAGNTGIGLALMGNASQGDRSSSPKPRARKRRTCPLCGAELKRSRGSLQGPQQLRSCRGRLAEEWTKSSGGGLRQPMGQHGQPPAHYEGTGPEIWDQTDGTVDGFICGRDRRHPGRDAMALRERKKMR